MKTLTKNKIWELTSPTLGRKMLDCKLVFTMKHNANGIIEKYRARLMAQEFIQVYRVDNQETFASIAKMNTIRILLSCALNLDQDLQPFDVKNVFLHRDLEVELYMKIFSEFEDERTQRNVCKLKNVLYGLKQSTRA